MYRFDYQKAQNLKQAVRHFEKAEDGVYLAGGMTLIPALKLRLAAPDQLIDLTSLQDLQGITSGDGLIGIGALTNHADVAASDSVKESIPALSGLAAGIGDPQVRNRGTLGGSIANNDPAADYPAAILGLDATIVTDRREIAADDFFTGMFETALEDGEIITAVRFPVPKRAAYMKFPNPVSRYALAGVFVAETPDDGARVAVTGAGACVFRVPAMETALNQSFSSGAIEGIRLAPDNLNKDLHASAEYRAHLVTVMAKRAVERILI